MKWKYVGKRRFVASRWRFPDDVIENDYKPPGDWIEIDNSDKPLEKKVDQVIKNTKIDATRNVLANKGMKELREIGQKYGAKDTKKSELVEEIINEKVKRGEL
jgi:hypothetical protein